MPRRSIAQLIVASDFQEHLTPANEEAWSALKYRIEAEWPHMLSFINDPKRSPLTRHWAAILLEGLKDPKGVEATAQLILDFKATDVKNGHRGTLRILASVVAKHPTGKAADLLLEAQRRGLLKPAYVATALGNLGRKSDIPILLQWLNSKEDYDRENALVALTLLGAGEAISTARALTADPEESVQLSA